MAKPFGSFPNWVAFDRSRSGFCEFPLGSNSQYSQPFSLGELTLFNEQCHTYYYCTLNGFIIERTLQTFPVSRKTTVNNAPPPSLPAISFIVDPLVNVVAVYYIIWRRRRFAPTQVFILCVFSSPVSHHDLPPTPFTPTQPTLVNTATTTAV